MPSADATVRIKADISKLKSEMQAAARQVRLVNSEFKAATAGMDDWTKSEEGLTAKIKQLNGTLDAQKKKLDLLNDEYKKTVELYGENSAAADKVRISINNQEAAISKTEKELKQYNTQLEELPKTLDDTGDAAEKAADGFTVIKGALADLVADGIRNAISALKDLAKEALNVGMEYESSMSNVKAISGATVEEIEALKDTSLELASQSKFTASEVADGFSYMAMAGWKTKEMLDGIEGIMNLAAASGADLATTSDIVTDALTAMGYQAKDAGRLADVMAAASSNANTNVEMMGSTFQYAAPLIGALGMSMEDTAVAIGLMANAGIKGDKAGTALRSTLNRLSAPPKQCAEEMEKLGLSLTDSDGKMKSLQQVMIELRGAFKNLSETEQTAAAKHIAGAEAMSGLLAIVNASDQDFQKLTVAVNNSAGAAEKMAQTMNDNVGGQLTLLKSKIEGIMIKLFERASGSMKKGIETVGKALDTVDWDKVGDKVGQFATKAAEFFAYVVSNSPRIISTLKAIGTAFAIIFVSQKITTTASAFSTLISVMTNAGSASKALSAAMSALGLSMNMIPVLALVSGLAALAIAVKKNNDELEAQAQATYGLSEKQRGLIDSVNESKQALEASTAARKEEGEAIDSNYRALENMKNSYNDLIDENGNVKAGSEELAQTLLGNLAEGLGVTIENLKENIDLNGQLSSSIDDLIQKKQQEAKITAFEDDYNQALKDEYNNWKQLTEASRDYAAKQNEVNELQEKYNKAAEEAQKPTMNPLTGAARIRELNQLSKELEAAKGSLEELGTTVESTKENWSTAQSTIENYDKALSEFSRGNAEETQAALDKLQNGIVNYGTATKQQLEQQVIDTRQNLDSVRQAYAKGVVDESFVESQEAALNAAIGELNKFGQQAGEEGKTAGENLKGGVGDGLAALQGTVEEMAGSAYNALETNLGDWAAVGEEKTGDFLGILDSKTGEAKTKGENLGSAVAEGAKSKTSEMEEPAEEAVKTYTNKIQSLDDLLQSGGRYMPETAAGAAESSASEAEKPGTTFATTYSDAIKSNAGKAKTASEELAKQAAAGADSGKTEAQTSGENFSQGFINGIGNLFSAAFEKAKELAKNAVAGLKQGQDEGSPSKLTYKSGSFFVDGYVNAIGAGTRRAVKAAAKMGTDSVNSLKKAQQEGSPSKLTYESGKMFTQGFINGIAGQEVKLINTVKGLVNKTLAVLLKLKDFNFSDVTANASSAFASGFQKQLDYMINRINYANQQQLKDFDNTQQALQDAADAEIAAAQTASEKKQKKIQKKIDKNAEKSQTKATKKKAKKLKQQLDNEKKRLDKATDKINEAYDKQIEEQKKMKESYSEASSAMIKEFTQAMQEYQTAAQKLIDDTMNAIADDYQAQYDALVSKQDNLIQKLKSAGDLFNLSNSNVMTMNDIQAQTAAIKQYAAKLKTIKQKVSGELFDQIASYDMKEGEAFIDRLLSMSEAELKAYSDAYDEKMRVSEELSKDIYKSDFDKIAANYKSAMEKAFADLPKKLEELGWQSFKGFLSGLTENTDYMEESVKTFIQGMIDTFKKQLKISSPSKVMENLGEFTGEGFADGLRDMVKTVQQAAKEITDSVKQSLDLGDMSTAKGIISHASGASGAAGGAYVGDRSQNITFIQNNNSPKALDRLTIYRQTNGLLFSAKVGLSNV